jgi:PAS domain S-box-containing protein
VETLHVGGNTPTLPHAPTATVAADEANRIIAVSPAALELLGYDGPDDLVGSRIVAIVPERFRQAHIAGFTMYLLVGRKPLLERPVQVPALRRDGTETDVEMTVRVERVGEGRKVFVATLRPVG